MNRQTKVYMVDLLLFVVFSVIAFLVPFPKNSVAFWVCYVAEVIAVVAQVPIFHMAFHENDEIKSKVYGFPIFRVGYLYLIAQSCVSFLFFFVSMLMQKSDHTPIVWLPTLLSVLLMAAAALGCIGTTTAREEIIKLTQQEEVDTAFMKQLTLDAQDLADVAKKSEHAAAFRKLAEDIRYSDPVSSTSIETEEMLLHQAFQTLKQMATSGEGDIPAQIDAVRNALNSRNRAAKAFK